MKINSIKNGVAVEVTGLDITKITESQAKELFDILTKKLVVVIKNQKKCPGSFTRTIWYMNKQISNWNQMVWDQYTNPVKVPEKFIDPDTFGNDEMYPVQRVTGMKKNGERTGIFATTRLDWHANLNGLDRADGVALQGWEGCENTSTSFLNTNLAYNDLSEDIKKKIEKVYCEYYYSPETWAPGTDQKQLDYMFRNGRKPYYMWLVQENAAGVKGLYFYTNNRCKVITEDTELYQTLYDHLFQDKYIYQHWWEPGDIVLMDQLLTLHKRDQNEPEILEKRVLHRVTFNISNFNGFIANRNKIDVNE